MPDKTFRIGDTITKDLIGKLVFVFADAVKWRRLKEIATSDYCSRCFNRLKCPSNDYAPCPVKDIIKEAEGEKG